MRRLFADYYNSEGCSCCRDTDAHDEAKEAIGKLLRVKKYSDNSGYDFRKYATKKGKP